MAVNSSGIKIEHKCNDCDTDVSKIWYLDREKGIGFKCLACYNVYRRAKIKARKRLDNKITVDEKGIEVNPGGRIPMVKVMQDVVMYLRDNGDRPNEFHTIASISAAINANYNTTHRAIKALNFIYTNFFNEYDLNIRRLKTKSNSNREKMEIMTIIRRSKYKL